MSSGKLSPRQKMINMMYLVLTALLALNVTAEVLKSFQAIADSLKASSVRFVGKNTDSGNIIKDAIQDEIKSNNHVHESLLANVDTLNARSFGMIQYLDAQADALATPEVGGAHLDPVTGKPDGRIDKIDELEKNYTYWMGSNPESNNGRGGGNASKMHTKLNGYIDWANKFYASLNNGQKANNGKGFSYLVEDPTKDPDPDVNDKSWEYITFHMTPVVANLAIVRKLQTDVEVVQNDLLDMIRQKLSQVKFKPDSLIAQSAPASRIVPSGLPFEADIFVTATFKNLKPKFSFAGGGAIPTDPSGNIGKLKITAPPLPAGATKAEQAYSAKVDVIGGDNTVNHLIAKGTFTVVRAGVEVSSIAVQVLYRDCGNDLKIDVPLLGAQYNPQFTSSPDVKIIPSPSDAKTVKVIPSGRKATIGVASLINGQTFKIGSTPTYDVIPPPPPTIAIYVDGKPHDGTSAIAKTSRVELYCVPDQNFVEHLPKDARYRMQNVKVQSKFGLGTASDVADPRNSNLQNKGRNGASIAVASIDLSSPKLRSGSTVYVQMDKVQRINFEGKTIDERDILQQNLTKVFTIK